MKKSTVTAVFSAVLLIILPAICRIALSGCSEAPPASSDTDQIITDSPEIITDNPVVTTDSPETITYNPEQSDNAPSDSGKDTSDPVSDAVDDSQDEQYTYNPDRDNLSCTDADAYSTEETGTGTESEAGVDSGDDPKVHEDFFGVGDEPFLDVLMRDDLPNFESIRRCRAKAQSLRPDLRASEDVQIYRFDREQIYFNFFGEV